MMERQLGQLVRLVDDLLDISRITRNRLELRKTQIDSGRSLRMRSRPFGHSSNQTVIRSR